MPTGYSNINDWTIKLTEWAMEIIIILWVVI